MDRLPQRDDLIYKEIEEFQDYELTNCVAYEMAIRNENISALVNKYLKKRFVFSYTEEKNDDIELLKNYGFTLETMLMTEILKILKEDIKVFSGLVSRNATYPNNILKNKINNNSYVYFEKDSFFSESFDDKNTIVEKNKFINTFIPCILANVEILPHKDHPANSPTSFNLDQSIEYRNLVSSYLRQYHQYANLNRTDARARHIA